MRRRLLSGIAALLFAALPAAAQFYVDGGEPAGVRWWQITTPDYRVIYPEGLDSLARGYADMLERVKRSVGATAGYVPNQEYRRPLPVVLHPLRADSNGSVAWTPSRMDLYTTPMFSSPMAVPWEEHLVVHESRHVAQMQFVNARPYRPFGFVLGQLFAGAATSVYGGPAFYEGDAVAAETELSPAGRGRRASFLEYWRASLREGDSRDFWKWRYGELGKFTPNYYTAGYVRAAGMRSVYGAQDFTARYYRRIFRKPLWPWPFFNYERTVNEVSGRRFSDAFAEITDTLAVRWKRDEATRAPFLLGHRIVPEARRFIDYTSPCYLGGVLYAIRSGITRAPELVRVESDGSVRRLSNFAYSTSRLKASEPLGRFYWSEIVNDTRWEMTSHSEIWYAGADGKHHRLSRDTRWYNPSVSPDGLRLAVTEYPVSGGSAILVIDARSGEELQRIPAPDGLQAVESAWIGESILVNGVSSEGSGIYDATAGWKELLPTGYSELRELFTAGDGLYFTSDIDGTTELYRFRDGTAERVTNLPVGGGSFCLTPSGDTLIFSELSTAGRYLKAAPSESLPVQAGVDFGKPHAYELARDIKAPLPIPRDSVITLARPERYNRLAHAFRFHSWAPMYVSSDAVSDLSFETLFSDAGLGATAFFQNDLSNFYGTIAYGALYNADKWTHLGEAKFTYAGLYPKFEGYFSISSDPASQYFLQYSWGSFKRQTEFSRSRLEGVPSLDASLLVYLPLNFSSGGWYRGVVPQVRASVSNSLITHGSLVPMNRVSAQVRGYVISATPSSCIYPRLGIGAEAGLSGRIGAGELFSPTSYLYLYGYLPGFWETHGWKVTAIAQMPVGEAFFTERFATVMPRGVESSELSLLASTAPFQTRVTLDYAFPFLPLGWSWASPVTYFRNLECTLHADGSCFTGGDFETMAIGSVGASVNFVLGNLLWLPFDTRLGVEAYYNFGTPEGLSPYRVGLVFNVDM